MLRVVAQELLRILQHDGETARSLQEARAGDHREDDQHDIDRRFSRLIAEDKRVDHEAEATDHRQPKSAVPYTDNQTDKEDYKAQQHFYENNSPILHRVPSLHR